jgi:hypothetical protein
MARRSQREPWRSDLRPDAVGFEGSTVGIADDGTFIGLARLTDEGADPEHFGEARRVPVRQASQAYTRRLAGNEPWGSAGREV